MCLFKVYIDKGTSKEIVAEDIAVTKKDADSIEVYNAMLERIAAVKHAEIVNVDTLNGVLILHKRE